ncbi:Uncharacterised protein [Mycobacterium tuberculosis]|nr:Uncharacterised protein [Mycobacterium tuberculosis]
MKVLSTISRAPWRCTSSATAAMSVTCKVGFVGVSRKTTFTSGVKSSSLSVVKSLMKRVFTARLVSSVVAKR